MSDFPLFRDPATAPMTAERAASLACASQTRPAWWVDALLADAFFLRAAGCSITDPAQAEQLRDRAEAIYDRLEMQYCGEVAA